MRPTLTLFRREFTAYFLSPIAYFLLVTFLLVLGWFFFYPTYKLLTEQGPVGVEWPLQEMLGSSYFWLGFLIIPAALTMRSFAEERGSGTLEVLLTAPLRDWQVVLAKYAACVGFYLILWLPTLAYLPILFGYRPGERVFEYHGEIGTTYLGLLLVGAMFLSLGLFISSLVRSQLVAVMLTLLASVLFIAPAFLRPLLDTSGAIYRIVYYFSVPLHFNRDFTRAQLDTRHLVLYGSVALFFLFMTVRSLESRRWR
jgi:ABC-2 type transport system permease protein